MKTNTKPTPDAPNAWLEEIAAAYKDAAGAIPFGPLVGHDVKPEDLFTVAPLICLKFRGLGSDRKLRKKATEGALSSYVATQERSPDVFNSPQIAFAFVYMAAHFALDLLEGQEVEAIMEYMWRPIGRRWWR